MKTNIDDVIGMAWSDKISFEEIKKKDMLFGGKEYWDDCQNIERDLKLK